MDAKKQEGRSEVNGPKGRLFGRVAVVTGGASGIGRAIVERFCAEGARVVVADMNTDKGKQLVDEGVAFVRTDVSLEQDIVMAVRTAVERFGRLDIMVNNAGVGGAFGPITELELEDWDYTFAVLARGVFLGTKHAARVLTRQQEGGAIINIASIAGLSGGAGPQTYSSAKAAVINFTRSVAIELAPARVRVNAICPGVISTPLLHQGREEEFHQLLSKAQPWPEEGRPEHIAGVALFLASDDSEFVTGEFIVVDGGLTATGPDLGNRLRTRPDVAGLVGVNRGGTGLRSEIRRRVEIDPHVTSENSTVLAKGACYRVADQGCAHQTDHTS